MSCPFHQIEASHINDIIELGRKMLNAPVHIIKNVPETLNQLQQKYRLILVTKGDLLEQQRKLRISNLEAYFHHIEIMSWSDLTFSLLSTHFTWSFLAFKRPNFAQYSEKPCVAITLLRWRVMAIRY